MTRDRAEFLRVHDGHLLRHSSNYAEHVDGGNGGELAWVGGCYFGLQVNVLYEGRWIEEMKVVTDLVVPQLEQLQLRQLLLLPLLPLLLLLLPLQLVAQLQLRLRLRLLVGVQDGPREHSHPLTVEAY